MKLSFEVKTWGYFADISEDGKEQHLEMADKAERLEEENEKLKRATDALSAKDARYYGELSGITLIRDGLQAYADILEGK